MAIVTKQIFNGNRRLTVQVVKTDGGAETDAIVVDKSTFVAPDGLGEPSKLIVEKIQYDVSTIGDTTPVILEWDNNTDEVIATLTSGEGILEWTESGGLAPAVAVGAGTGDIIITNVAVAGGGFTITLWLRKKDT